MKPVKNISFTILILLILSQTALFSQNENQQKMSPEQKAWMEYMMPGPMQKILEKNVGKWKTVSKFWQSPEAEAMVSEGIAESEMILGGRYLKSTYHGTAMGMPMEGQSLDAFDKALGKFQSIWIDNMGTGISTSEGTYDKASNTITYKGSMVDPVSKKKVTYKAVVKFLDDNTHVFDMYMTHAGKEFKSMEINYTRIPDKK